MKLTQDTLPNYFTIADRHSSWHQTPTNTFNFVSRDSNTLIVTVGDSWTWGSDISENNCDDNFRITHLYGNVLSKKLDTDWLNLGLSASSNFWATAMIEELGQLIPQLDYQSICVICVFTGAGRWFNTQYDRYIYYPTWVQDNITKPEDYIKLPVKFNQDCVNRIYQALSPYEHVMIKFGTNFVDPIGLESVPLDQRLLPWYRVMGCSDDIISPICIDGVKALLRMPEVIKNAKQLDFFKEWMLDVIPVAEKRNNMLKDPAKFRNYHPLKEGHQQWAEYLCTQLNRD